MTQAFHNAMLAGKKMSSRPTNAKKRPLSNQAREFVSSCQELLKQQSQGLQTDKDLHQLLGKCLPEANVKKITA